MSMIMFIVKLDFPSAG